MEGEREIIPRILKAQRSPRPLSSGPRPPKTYITSPTSEAAQPVRGTGMYPTADI